MRVLLVEDSGPTRDLVTGALEDAGIEVSSASRLATGLRRAMSDAVDVIVLDLMLPDGDGLDLCRELRASGNTTPILCLTARAEVADRIRGLEAGADDYLKKPFAIAELVARLRALVRRGGQPAPHRMTAGSTELDFTARRCVIAGTEVFLTTREWMVLAYLAARAGRVASREDLLQAIWSESGKASSNSLDVIVGRLRRKIAGDGSHCAIRTIRGEGFVFELSP
ncbi:MAG: response regulator transcription factor [Candidatus Eisenbacteria bacterium]